MVRNKSILSTRSELFTFIAHRSLAPLWVSAALFQTGCAGPRHGYPDQALDTDAQIATFEQHFDFTTLINNYYNETNAENRRVLRNQIVQGRMLLIDLQYAKFVQEFSGNRKDFETVADLAVLGLSTAGALFTPAGTVRVLSGSAAVVTGSRFAVDRNYFYEKTVPVLINAMNAQRTTVRARIEQSIGTDDAAYSLFQAWSDTTDYYLSGTFDGALQSIQARSGEQKHRADELINMIRTNADASPIRTQIQAYFLSLSEADRDQFMQSVGQLARELYNYQGRPTGFIQSATREQLNEISRRMNIPRFSADSSSSPTAEPPTRTEQ